MSVDEVVIPSTSLESKEGSLVTIVISGMSLAIRAEWEYRQKSWYHTYIWISMHCRTLCSVS